MHSRAICIRNTFGTYKSWVKAVANEIEEKEVKQNEGRKVKAHGSHPESPNRQMMRGEEAAAPGEEDEEDFKDTMDAISESANASADIFSLLPHGADVNAVSTVGTVRPKDGGNNDDPDADDENGDERRGHERSEGTDEGSDEED